ncbi:histidine phosphatase family protein [Pectobacterium versatile]|nr:histidine phosphatase family protein [Pectobacterium versatile]
MRHGKPSVTGEQKVAAYEMSRWIKRYDLSDIGNHLPPEASRILARKAQMAISSPLPRAISSATVLNLKPEIVDDIFREAELPVYLIPAIKLSPFSWIAFFRLIWLCGMSQEAESLAMAKRRARRAADILVNHAREHSGPILMVGHGIMNQLIAKELTSLGWKKRGRVGKGYWGANIFQLP